MSYKKISISLPPEVADLVSAAAEAAGMSVSAWIAAASEHAAAIQAGLRAMDEWDAESGPVPQELLDEADGIIDRLIEEQLTASPEPARTSEQRSPAPQSGVQDGGHGAEYAYRKAS